MRRESRMLNNKCHKRPSQSLDTGDALSRMTAAMHSNKGVDLGGFRDDFLRRRIGMRMEAAGIDDLDRYTDLIESDSREREQLLGALGIKVTRFFRNSEVFGLIGAKILPELLFNRSQSTQRSLRIWCAGCATGEEPYSMAILAREVYCRSSLGCLVFGTDIDDEVLETARRANYSPEALQEAQLRIVETCFQPSEIGYALKETYRSIVHFSHADLTADKGFLPQESVFRTYDLVLCRNVLIYYREHRRKKALANLVNSLPQGGFLVLGEAEYLPDELRCIFDQPYAGVAIYKKL